MKITSARSQFSAFGELELQKCLEVSGQPVHFSSVEKKEVRSSEGLMLPKALDN